VLVVVVGAATVALAMTLPTVALTDGPAAPAVRTGGTAAPAMREPAAAPTVVPPTVELPAGVARPIDALPAGEPGRAAEVGLGVTATTGMDGLAPARTVSELLSSPFTTGVGLAAGIAAGGGVVLTLAGTGSVVGL
jgi:hypothetical protein